MNRRYRLIFSNPVSHTKGIKADDFVKVHPHFTPNFPANVLEESQIAGNLEGIVLKETQLGILSIVNNVKDEINKLEAESSKRETDAVMRSMFGKQELNSDQMGGITDDATVQLKQLNGAQTQSLIAIMAQFTAGSLTEGQAVNLISTAIGVSKEEARQILNGEL